MSRTSDNTFSDQTPHSLRRLIVDELKAAEYEAQSRKKWFPDVWRLAGSVIPNCWRNVLWVTLWALFVSVLDLYYQRRLELTNSVTPLLSVVVGLLLVFRNGSAFARWEDGRKTFGAMISAVRSAARFMWIHNGIANYDASRKDQDGNAIPFKHELWTAQDQQNKIDAVRVMVGVVVGAKHWVREEYNVHKYEDLSTLLPRTFHGRTLVRDADYGSLRGEYQQSHHHSSVTTTEAASSSANQEEQGLLYHQLDRPSVSLPLLLLHHLQLYLASCKAKGFFDVPSHAGYNRLQGHLASLTDELGTIERLSKVAIPAVYGIHLKQCVTLYLFLLPLTLVETMSWKMVPFITAFAFVLMGVEGIAVKIEYPFGQEDADLPLDLLCSELRNEMEHMLATFPDSGDL